MAGAEELYQAHVSLSKDLQELDRTIRTDTALTPRSIGDQLAATRKPITDHFRSEEENGWKDAVLKQEPRLEHSVQHLLDEHRELVESLDTLIDEAAAAQSVDNMFREKVLRWIERIRDHEAREDELLEEAFVEDLGAGD